MKTQVLKITTVQARKTLREVGGKLTKGVWYSVRDLWDCCQASGIETGTRLPMVFGMKVNCAFQGKGTPGELKVIDLDGITATRRIGEYLDGCGNLMKEYLFESVEVPQRTA